MVPDGLGGRHRPRRALELAVAVPQSRPAVVGRAGQEVAHELRMTVGAVYAAKSRVLRRLREELQDLL